MSNPVETENEREIGVNNEINDNGKQVEELKTKIAELEKDKKDIYDNFNAQRARLQKIYIQKEEELKSVFTEHVKLETEVERLTKELDETKSQLCIAGIIKENEVEAEKRKAQAEIATLNQIVQDTVEVFSTSQNEVKKLKQVIQLLESQVNKLRGEKEKESMLLAPGNMLSGAKTLARKVVGQLGSDADSRLQDNLEDSMKKAQEDTEVLRSLVIPLEQKIQELTSKLQLAEQKIQKYEPDEIFLSIAANDRESERSSSELFRKPSQDGENSSKITDMSDASCAQTATVINSDKNVSCDMCANYEAQLVSQQKLNAELSKEREKIETDMEKLKGDLIKETEFRKTMEDKWNEKKEIHKAKVAELQHLYEGAENEVKNLRRTFAEVSHEVKNQMKKLSYDREKINSRLEEIQKENDNLLGKHGRHSRQLREESINFPDKVEELQFILLKTHEELIAAKVAKETKEEQECSLKYEIQLLRDQLNSELNERNAKDVENSKLSHLLSVREKENITIKTQLENLKDVEKNQNQQINSLRAQVAQLMEENKRCEETVSKLQSQVGSLQHQLDTNEAVQKDFVLLSQSLQMELEKIRVADTEVRWQYEDDVDDCPSCKASFSSGKKKDRCRHCGKVFCPSCVSYTVVSGPRKRQSKVCQVCHTLLNREIAPYFSQDPPPSFE